MEQTNPIVLEMKLTAEDLWRFSMYHANKGMLGIFNVMFSLGALFLLITRWGESQMAYRVLLILCVLLFTVWQPLSLWQKAGRQAASPMIKEPMVLSFSREGIVVTQSGKTVEVLWENVGRAVRIKNMTALYTDRVHAYVLPDRIPGDKKDALCALICEHVPRQRRNRGF